MPKERSALQMGKSTHAGTQCGLSSQTQAQPSRFTEWPAEGTSEPLMSSACVKRVATSQSSPICKSTCSLPVKEHGDSHPSSAHAPQTCLHACNQEKVTEKVTAHKSRKSKSGLGFLWIPGRCFWSGLDLCESQHFLLKQATQVTSADPEIWQRS